MLHVKATELKTSASLNWSKFFKQTTTKNRFQSRLNGKLNINQWSFVLSPIFLFFFFALRFHLNKYGFPYCFFTAILKDTVCIILSAIFRRVYWGFISFLVFFSRAFSTFSTYTVFVLVWRRTNRMILKGTEK